MIKTIIIDSNPSDGKKLHRTLRSHFQDQVQIEGVYTDVHKGVAAIVQMGSGLIFCDTSASNDQKQNPFDSLPADRFSLIITSLSNQFALDAFRYNALHYLLKPLTVESVKTALSRLPHQQSPRSKQMMLHIDHLVANVEQLKHITSPKKIVIPTMSGFELINIVDILFCQSKVNYTNIHLKNRQKIIVAKTLLEFEKMLAPHNFLRIHNSHLINLAYVKSYVKGKSGSVCLTDGTFLEISSRKKDTFLKAVHSI